MSRLDSFIRRMMAQRACLDAAADAVEDLPGPVLELGLGNGRTYDHLRERLPGREIWVFERHPNPHPVCVPPPERLIVGDLADTLPGAVARIGAKAALVHADLGAGDPVHDRRVAALLAEHLAAVTAPGAVVVSDQPFASPAFEVMPLPEAAPTGRYLMLKRIG